MGFAVARAAVEAGAQVQLIAGPCSLDTPLAFTGRITRIDVTSAKEMHSAVTQSLPADIFIGVAAVADWAVANSTDRKIKKESTNASPELQFAENPDILATVAKSAKNGKPYCVGFAAETHDLQKNVQEKRARKGVPLLVGNIGPQTFGSDEKIGRAHV